MLSWLLSPRAQAKAEAEARYKLGNCGDRLMTDLVMAEIEQETFKFESEQEMQRSQRSLQENAADYSWLISDTGLKRRKYLSMQERLRIENLCFQIDSEEWNDLMNNWRARVKTPCRREQIIESFSAAVNDIVSSRPRPASVADMLMDYIMQRPSRNQVTDKNNPGANNENDTQMTALSARSDSCVQPYHIV
ncbi:hypothetical protein QR680_003212 [Steinernema hermaphroditum]|uniref:Uncharacterized protein n=1 Tax=Steinernema hermaphroditum TaxID=289476 RepID=A0AA39H5U1_9BILA|nr:hypothetical protein QR680_003212 [Steinernema hermaphroditum]